MPQQTKIWSLHHRSKVEQAIQHYKKETSSKNTKNAASKKQDVGPILKEKKEAKRVSTVNDS